MSRAQVTSDWSKRYGKRHQLVRLTTFPSGITPPKKVRIYSRADHYVLQVWDPSCHGTISDRVDGDLLAALMRARELDDRIVNFRRTGHAATRLTHTALVDRFVADLEQRAAAGEIDPKTVDRYRGALVHYLTFAASGEQARYGNVSRVDRSFQLQLAAYLRSVEVTPNGRTRGTRRPMIRADYVLDVVRAMYCWAADPLRGNLLGDGFVNPFLRRPGTRQPERRDPTAEPAITTGMAAEFLGACDEWQLPVFSGLLLWGLRPAELGWLFAEDLQDGWIQVRCHPEFDYLTKGRRDKRVPILEQFQNLWLPGSNSPFVLARRKLIQSPWQDRTSLHTEFERRTARSQGVREQRDVRDRLFLNAGGLSYDQVQGEFHRVAATLQWGSAATLKGFRHLFATALENGGMPEFYRRYLLGQSLGRSAIVTYTHLNQLRLQYERVIASELAAICEAISQRQKQLQTAGSEFARRGSGRRVS